MWGFTVHALTDQAKIRTRFDSERNHTIGAPSRVASLQIVKPHLVRCGGKGGALRGLDSPHARIEKSICKHTTYDLNTYES